MNLGEIRNLAWWYIDDNEANPTELPSSIATQLINEAIKDISPYLNIIKSATLTFTSGVASLPSDFMRVIEVKDGDRNLIQIADIRLRADDDSTATQYFIPNNSQIYIYGITPEGTVTMQYQAYEAILNDDSDEPVNVPQELHSAIAECYVKAKYRQAKNRFNDYSFLMDLWEQVKKKAFALTCNDRTTDEAYDGDDW